MLEKLQTKTLSYDCIARAVASKKGRGRGGGGGGEAEKKKKRI